MSQLQERVVWTPRLRRFVMPRRAEDVKAARPPKLAKAWNALRTAYEPQRRQYLNGVERADAEHARLMTAVDAMATAESPPAEPDAMLLAGASEIIGYAPQSFLPLNVALAFGGLELVLEVCLRTSELLAKTDEAAASGGEAPSVVR